MFTYNQIFENKKNILFITAHPDDVIVYFCALIHRLRNDGKEVYVVSVTNGARGSRENVVSEEELAKQRIEEEIAALKTLDVTHGHFFCLDYKDGEVESNLKLIGEITYYIRKYKADLVGTHEPNVLYQHTYDKKGFFVQHRDHRKVGEAVIDAMYPFSRDRSFFPEHAKKGITPHSVYDLLLTDERACNFDFDYTDEKDVKRAAYRAHKSQFTSEEMITEWMDAVKFDGRYFEKFQYVKLLW